LGYGDPMSKHRRILPVQRREFCDAVPPPTVIGSSAGAFLC
jgi:hypothetical protein